MLRILRYAAAALAGAVLLIVSGLAGFGAYTLAEADVPEPMTAKDRDGLKAEIQELRARLDAHLRGRGAAGSDQPY